MKPVFQTRFGAKGNCFEACIASLLDLSIKDIPDLRAYEDNGLWVARLNKWLAEKGLAYFEARIPANELEDFFSDKDFFHVIIGPTARHETILHAVVGRKGKMIHDPYIGRLGIKPESSIRIGVIVCRCG